MAQHHFFIKLGYLGTLLFRECTMKKLNVTIQLENVRARRLEPGGNV